MVTALIITVTVAIIFIALFLDERGTVKEYRDESKSQRAEISRLRDSAQATPGEPGQAVVSRPPVDDQDLWDLTPALVGDVVKFSGYVPSREEDCITFMIQGEKYAVFTDRLPYIIVMKRFGLENDRYDMELMRQAAAKSTENRLIGKASISDDGRSLAFYVGSIETKYGPFRDVFSEYVRIINDIENIFGETYNGLLRDKEDMAKLEANGIPIEAVSNREGKIVS